MPGCIFWVSPCNRLRHPFFAPPFGRVAPVPAICRHLLRLATVCTPSNARLSFPPIRARLRPGFQASPPLPFLPPPPSSRILVSFPSSFDTRTSLRRRFGFASVLSWRDSYARTQVSHVRRSLLHPNTFGFKRSDLQSRFRLEPDRRRLEIRSRAPWRISGANCVHSRETSASKHLVGADGSPARPGSKRACGANAHVQGRPSPFWRIFSWGRHEPTQDEDEVHVATASQDRRRRATKDRRYATVMTSSQR